MQRRIARANPFETTPPHGFTGLSAGGLRPQDHNGVPMTVHVTDNSDDEITMASDLKTSGVPMALTSSANKKQGRGRINSISKLLKTPLVSRMLRVWVWVWVPFFRCGMYLRSFDRFT